VPCTIIEAGPCVVTQVKPEETDGYRALQLSYGDRKEKNTPKALQSHFAKAKTPPKRKVIEFKNFGELKELGEVITVDIFKEGELVDITGWSKGKGFQGVVKRHGFSGVGMMSHGQHNRQRAAGSIGASSDPSRVVKGMRMAGRKGNDKVKVQDLDIIKVMPEKNLILVNGSVPGHKGAYLILETKPSGGAQ